MVHGYHGIQGNVIIIMNSELKPEYKDIHMIYNIDHDIYYYIIDEMKELIDFVFND